MTKDIIKEKLKCYCKSCGKSLKTKREYIEQDDTCDNCFKVIKEFDKKFNVFGECNPPYCRNLRWGGKIEDIETFILKALEEVRNETLKGNVFTKVKIEEETKVPEEIVEHIKETQKQELIKEIENRPGKKLQPVGGLSNIEWFTKQDIITLIKTL